MNPKDKSIEEIIQFADQKGFSYSEKFDSLYFYPHHMDWNIYLAVGINSEDAEVFDLKEHKFVNFRKYQGKKVSRKWLEGFINFRSKEAKNETNLCLKQKEINQKTIIINELVGFDTKPKENIPDNTPLTSGNLDFIMSDETGGPHDENWDSGDWEDYMSGPDIEDE